MDWKGTRTAYGMAYATPEGYAVHSYDAANALGGTGRRWMFIAPNGEQHEAYGTADAAKQDAERHRRGPWWSRCEDFATAVDNLPADLSDTHTQLNVIALAVEHRLTTHDFVELDERPGAFRINGRSYTADGSHWHSRLRRTRNGDNNFFDILRTNSTTEVPA